MSQHSFEKRIEKLRMLLTDDSEAILITNEINVGYFTNFQHSEGSLIVTRTKNIFLVDFRYFEAAQKFAKCCEVVCFSKFYANALEILKKYEIKSLYIEASDVSLFRYNLMKKTFSENGIQCVTTQQLDNKISRIRLIKDDDECSKILKAQQIAEKSYLEVLNFLKPGVTERKIAIELEHIMKLNGAERVSFDLITITGKKTSLPHGVPSDDVVCDGDFFTMDIGAVFEGYHSDTTRTVAVNHVSEEQKEIYDIVLKAQLAVLDAVKPSVKCSEIDSIARNIISDAGYSKYFGHATGHGVGLEIHEAPAVSPKSDIVLEEGMVITDEPGIYIPNKFGVRIEDMLCVTKNGYKNFVTLPKELIIV